jgi:predicted kinase
LKEKRDAHDPPDSRFYRRRKNDICKAHDKFREYCDSIDELIWDMAALFLKKGHDVIMDMGFWSRTSRDRAREFAKENKAEVKLYAVVCPENVMWKRVLERTYNPSSQALFIDENAFELFKKRFEPLEPDEEHIIVDTSAGLAQRPPAR